MLIQRDLNLFANVGDLLEPHCVNFFSGHCHRHEGAHQRGVAGLAVGVARHGQRLARLAQIFVLDEVGKAIECWRNFLVINLFGGLAEGGIITSLGGAEENAIGANQGSHLSGHRLNGHPRGAIAEPQALSQVGDFIVDIRRHRGESGKRLIP